VGFGEALDRLLTQSVASLVRAKVVRLDEIAVDGTKVRAPASAKSFTGGGRLDRLEAAARARIEALKAEVEADPGAVSRRRQAARTRAAREMDDKVAKARAALAELAKEKKAREKTHPKDEKKRGARKVSLSDIEARKMSFADGAGRAGYNIQVAALPGSGLVVAIEATDRRNDTGLAPPMVDQIARRYGRAPQRLLIDEGYVGRADIEALASHAAGAVEVYMPARQEKREDELTAKARSNRRSSRAKESSAVRQWRARMLTEEAALVFKRRKLIERVNAHFKNRGFGRLTVRGLVKTRAVSLWHALASNLMVSQRLVPA
jgi:hypothetical protein